ncbi:hypothetical protein Tco_1323405 [Tanacetum coccineum]
MRQREKLELDAHVMGILELRDESTSGGSIVTSEKESFSGRVASEKYPGDRKFFEIHQKYAEVFKNPIEFGYHESSLGDDGNGDDDTGNGDDDIGNGDDDTMNGDDDTGNGDDDAGVDDVVNEDEYDNVDGSDSSITDKEVHVEDDGNRVVDGNSDVQDDNGGSKKQVE